MIVFAGLRQLLLQALVDAFHLLLREWLITEGLVQEDLQFAIGIVNLNVFYLNRFCASVKAELELLEVGRQRSLETRRLSPTNKGAL